MFFLEAFVCAQELEAMMFCFFMFGSQFCLTVFISEDKCEYIWNNWVNITSVWFPFRMLYLPKEQIPGNLQK